MWRTLKSRLECLVGVLLCLSAVQLQLLDGNPARIKTVGCQMKGAAISTLRAQRQWRHSITASASMLPSTSPEVQPPSPVQPPSQIPVVFPTKSIPAAAPAPSLIPTVFAPDSAITGTTVQFSVTKSITPISSLQLPTLPSVSSPSPLIPVSAPPTVEKPILVVQPPLLPLSNNISSIQPQPASLLLSPPTQPSRATSSPSATAPLFSPPIGTPSNSTVTSSDAPLASGCCATNMVPKPGLPSDSCMCVYPIRLELVIDDVSTTFTNWSGVLQEDLASQLSVEIIQIEIISFQFSGPNLSLVIVIGPLTSVSFSLQQAETIKTDLDHFKVHFNSSLFGNYTLVRFLYYEPPLPPPVQTPSLGIPPLPLTQMFPQDGGNDSRTRHRLHLWHIIVIAAATVITTLVLLILLWRYLLHHGAEKMRFSMKGISSRAISSPFDATSFATSSIPRSITTRLFTFEELRQATNNFEQENVLGEGGFGRVYKGVLKDGTAVAIKRLSGGSQGDREFVVEVEMLSRLHHRNLVKLVGYYTSRDSSQHLLCYELIPNGSLEAWLHGPLGENQPLDWDTRMKIALDAARGLAYLHEDSQPCVIHRDFKASNILIENNFHAKVADFGLAKQAPEGQINYVSTQVMGTFGYVAPEYAMTGHLLVKSDVYSYGVVLLELLSGRKPVDMSQPSGQENLVTWARPILRDKERLGELADPRLLNKYPTEDFAQVAAIAAACVAPEAGQRPTMGEVVQSLKMLQRQSEYTTMSGERTASTDDILPCVLPSRSFVASIQNTQQTSAVFESDGSSSVFSSGPFSGLALDNDTFSRCAVFSEDLHEGR